MHSTNFAAFFNRPPPGLPKADRPHRSGLNPQWKKPEHPCQDKQISAMDELLNEVIRTFQL